MMVQGLDSSIIKKAADALGRDLLVAFPTETVYGLGANAESRQALTRLYEVKGRPGNHPVIVHLYCLEQLYDYASVVPEPALALARRFWPGPLTLILPKSDRVSSQVTGGQESVGLRMPRHQLALALLKEFGRGVAAPSANRFGRLSPTTAADVAREFGTDVAMVLDGGPCQVGIESTIVDFSRPGELPRLLRPGMLLPEAIEAVVGRLDKPVAASRDQADVRAPGNLASHYAPTTPLELVSWAELAGKLDSLQKSGGSCAILSFKHSGDLAPAGADSCVQQWIVGAGDASVYAQNLYANLRQLDACQAGRIYVEAPPPDESWLAVRDRLSRAAVKPTVAQNEVTYER